MTIFYALYRKKKILLEKVLRKIRILMNNVDLETRPESKQPQTKPDPSQDLGSYNDNLIFWLPRVFYYNKFLVGGSSSDSNFALASPEKFPKENDDTR